MGRIGLMIAVLGLAIPLSAQSITVKSKDGKVATHGEADKAAPGDTDIRRAAEADPEALKGFLSDLEKAGNVTFADGDLTADEIKALDAKARERLEKDMAKLQERERENAYEPDAGDKAEEALDIKKARYRASMRALERDLLSQLEQLRKPGGDGFEDTADDLEDKIKDTFADLHDAVDDGSSVTWSKTLETSRKFYSEYNSQIAKWAEAIGVSAEVPNARERISDMEDGLLARVKRLRMLGGDKYEDELDGVQDRIKETYGSLREKLDDATPKAWTSILGEADKFTLSYAAELDGWAKRIGGDKALPNAFEQLAALKSDIKARIKDLRRIGGEEYEEVIDEIVDRYEEVFADLKDKLHDNEPQGAVLETAAKFHRQFSDTIDAWQRKIVGSEKVERKLPEPAPRIESDTEYPEKDVDLPKGEQMDIIEGVRVARLMPMPKKQLGLKNGLSVNEITDADGALARAGLEVYDIIIKIGSVEIDSRTGLRDEMSKLAKGAEYDLVILRDGVEKTIKAKK